jgi:hypothetical protein
VTNANALRRVIATTESTLAELRAMLDAIERAETEASTEILADRHLTVAQLAGKLRVSEKTARSIGVAAGAKTQVGGRVYYDLTSVERYVASQNYRVLPCSSLSEADPAPDHIGAR